MVSKLLAHSQSSEARQGIRVGENAKYAFVIRTLPHFLTTFW